MFVRALKTNN